MSFQTQPTTWATVSPATKKTAWSPILLLWRLLSPTCPSTPTYSPPQTALCLGTHPPGPSPRTPSPKSSTCSAIPPGRNTHTVRRRTQWWKELERQPGIVNAVRLGWFRQVANVSVCGTPRSIHYQPPPSPAVCFCARHVSYWVLLSLCRHLWNSTFCSPLTKYLVYSQFSSDYYTIYICIIFVCFIYWLACWCTRDLSVCLWRFLDTFIPIIVRTMTVMALTISPIMAQPENSLCFLGRAFT